MSNDDKVKAIDAQIKVEIPSASSLPANKTSRLNTKELKRLAKKIRKNLEDNPVEAPIHPHPSLRP